MPKILRNVSVKCKKCISAVKEKCTSTSTSTRPPSNLYPSNPYPSNPLPSNNTFPRGVRIRGPDGIYRDTTPWATPGKFTRSGEEITLPNDRPRGDAKKEDGGSFPDRQQTAEPFMDEGGYQELNAEELLRINTILEEWQAEGGHQTRSFFCRKGICYHRLFGRKHRRGSFKTSRRGSVKTNRQTPR